MPQSSTKFASLEAVLRRWLIAAGLEEVEARSYQDRHQLWLTGFHAPPALAHPQQRLQALAGDLHPSLPPTLAQGSPVITVQLQLIGATSPYYSYTTTEDTSGLLPPDPDPFAAAALALPDTRVQPPLAKDSWSRRYWLLGRSGLAQLAHFWGYTVAGLILLASGLAAYGVTRPCVVGSCDRISQSQSQAADARTQLAAATTPADLTAAAGQLEAAAAPLRTVPPWSPHHDSAKAALDSYRLDLKRVSGLQRAQERAMEAAVQAQNPPHPVARWVRIQQLWRQAVSALEAIPQTSPVAPLAQQKLQEYQANYDAISHRVEAEEAAQQSLNQALQTARQAERLAPEAATQAEWQQLEQLWQSALSDLRQIPQGTLAHAQAQTHLDSYRPQLARTQLRRQGEDTGASHYRQALSQAQRGQTAAQQNQWTLAVNHYRQALAHARTVPTSTEYQAAAQALVPAYQQSLEQSRQQLQKAITLQQLQDALAALCGDPKACSATATATTIRVVLAAPYDQALDQAITPPDSPLSAPVTTDIQPLVEQMMALGNRGQQSLEIYDTRGAFIARYRPDLGGFVRQ